MKANSVQMIGNATVWASSMVTLIYESGPNFWHATRCHRHFKALGMIMDVHDVLLP